MILGHCAGSYFGNRTAIMNGLEVGRKMHENMISSVLKAPINLFFDVTPIGKVISRFSGAIGSIDGGFYHAINGVWYSTLSMVCILLINFIASPLVILGAIFVGFLGHRIYKSNIKGLREVWRIESSQSSPYTSFFSETFSGSTSIRAFNRQGDFQNEAKNHMNNHVLASQIEQIVIKHWCIQLQMVTNIFMLFGYIAILAMRG